MDPAVIQEELLRFEGRFEDRLREGGFPAESSPDLEIRRLALEQRLAYISSLLDIVSGRDPVVNFVDAIAFVDLCADAFRRFWLPQVFGDLGIPIEKAFDESSDDLWSVASRYVDASQEIRLREVVSSWRERNSSQVAVESMRLSAFSGLDGRSIDPQRAALGGLVRDLRSALQSADDAVLLGERALHYAQRAPYLMRLHAKLAVHDVLGESRLRLRETARSALPAAAVGLTSVTALVFGSKAVRKLISGRSAK